MTTLTALEPQKRAFEIADPHELGLSSTRLERITQRLQHHIDEQTLSGLLAMIVRRGKIGYVQCFGMADIEAARAMQPDTLFRIQSMTKTVTSVAIMMLYEEGYFRLTDPISRYIPEFSNVKVGVSEQHGASGQSELTLVNPEQEVTILHLLLHTSGLVYPNPNGSVVERLVGDLIEREEIRRDATGNIIYAFVKDELLGGWIKRLVQFPLAHQPGTTVHYGFSVDVLGYLVKVLSGMNLGQFFKQRIFAPLGMIDTGFHVPPEKIERLATLYHVGNDGFQVVDGGLSSSWARPKQFLSGGGGPGRGLISTATDYARFAQMLLNRGEFAGERLLSRKTVELMTSNHLPDGTETPFKKGLGLGFGLWIMEDMVQSFGMGSIGSFGWDGGDGTRFWVDPTEEMIGIIMAQSHGTPWVAQDQFPILAYQAIDD